MIGPIGGAGALLSLEAFAGTFERARIAERPKSALDLASEPAAGLMETAALLALAELSDLTSLKREGETEPSREAQGPSGAMDSESYRVTIGAHTAGPSAGLDLYTAREAMRGVWFAPRKAPAKALDPKPIAPAGKVR